MCVYISTSSVHALFKELPAATGVPEIFKIYMVTCISILK